MGPRFLMKGRILGRYQSGMGQIKGHFEQRCDSRVFNVTVLCHDDDVVVMATLGL